MWATSVKQPPHETEHWKCTPTHIRAWFEAEEENTPDQPSNLLVKAQGVTCGELP